MADQLIVNESDYIEESIKDIKNRYLKRKNNQCNYIPSPLIRFNKDFIGIEQSQYIVITAGTKCGKTQFTNYLYVFHALEYAYTHKEELTVNILYFALEETPIRITQRYISYLLYTLSNGKIQYSPQELRSGTNTQIPEELFILLETPEYKKRLNFFKEHINFITTESNPTGIYKYCRAYALNKGTVQTETITYKEEKYEKFIKYIPDNPNDYNIIIIDHIGLIETERGYDLKQSIDKLSTYLAKYLRNRYHFTCVVIQQQAFDNKKNDSYDTLSTTSLTTLSDSRYTSRDADIILSLYSPFQKGLRKYLNYDITIFKDNIRFLTILANRNGLQGGCIALYFNGATSYFKEMPLPDSQEIITLINQKKQIQL